MNYYFDLDGTLIDSKKRHYVVLKKALDECGVRTLSVNQNDFINSKDCGISTRQYLMSLNTLDNDLVTKICDYWTLHIEDEEFLSIDTLYSDSLDILNTCSLKKRKIFFLTARKNHVGVLQEIERLNISKYPENIIIIDPFNAEKGKTDILINSQEECMIIGDTETEYNAAIKSGCKYYLLNRGFRNNIFWKKYNIKTHDNLLEMEAFL